MFSKTRIVYYDNQASGLVIGDSSNLYISQVGGAAGFPYVSVEIPSTVHNWSIIPLNAYGLYCTFGEIQSLVENNDSFCPKSIEITVGHSIPLATYPGTASTTQLSFNNTIYSLIAKNDDGYIGAHTGISAGEVPMLCRTFDGVVAGTTNTRVELPKRNMYFRIPYHDIPLTTDTSVPTNENIPWPTNTTEGVSNLGNPLRNQYAQTLYQLVDSYIPELLQNNDATFTLYPGENQYQHTFDDFNTDFATIDCSGPSFNQTLWQVDQRLQCNINRDFTNRSQNEALVLPLLFQIKGNNNDIVPQNFSQATETLANNNVNMSRFNDIMLNRSTNDDYTSNMPKIFIKGVPIVDAANNLVPHNFCCTLTYTLHVDTTPRSHMNTNRLQWAMTYPYIQPIINSGGAVADSHYIHQCNFAKKPWRHNIFKRKSFRIYNNTNWQTAAATINDERVAKKSQFKTSPANLTLVGTTTPDDLNPSLFGFTMPFQTLYEGHSVIASTTAIPTTATTTTTTTIAGSSAGRHKRHFKHHMDKYNIPYEENDTTTTTTTTTIVSNTINSPITSYK